ncbi:Glycosyltransferase involved in cell wall bisynthesis [Vreelandella subterranea]|uniref:Glycosyltransferase involved in cell wall bisynthesis n=1 Tax=Vreelandella subterranea TaxID=416874 RepID=A0A1H9Q4S2_9GAMM|nr:glycosyltransferase family 2 protein [Halomonas subterranea]SER55444.1 Glycosyltransferase involved in cell wall bisynthesis [Halomonas subterranea]
MQPITGIVITLNEEDNISDCLFSLEKICDELIVVDSGSTDKTVDIARKHGAAIYTQEYLGDGPQKSFGVTYAKNDWIISLDADERLNEDAIKVIQSLTLNDTKIAYSFYRKNHVGNHWIKAAGFYPDTVVRLYNRKTSGYLSKKAHSSVKSPVVHNTKTHINHFTYKDLSDWIYRINILSTRDAWAMNQSGKKASPISPIVHGINALIRKLVFKGGIFQGSDGILVAVTTAFHAYMKYAKLNEIRGKNIEER